jgi:hypothetical protein
VGGPTLEDNPDSGARGHQARRFGRLLQSRDSSLVACQFWFGVPTQDPSYQHDFDLHFDIMILISTVEVVLWGKGAR